MLFTSIILFTIFNVVSGAGDPSQYFNLAHLSKVTKEYNEYLQHNNVSDVLKVSHELDSLSIFKTPKLLLEKLQNYSNSEVSVTCLEDLKAFASALTNKESWAFSMIDAFGKIGAGITQGNFVWPGSFSICNSVIQGPPYPNYTEPFVGQYCWVVATPGDKFNLPKGYKQFMVLRTAVCIPDSCANNDLNRLLADLNAIPIIKEYATLASACIPASRDIWSDRRAVICLIFVFIMAAIIVTGTLYDVYLQALRPLLAKSKHKLSVSVSHQDLTQADELADNNKSIQSINQDVDSMILATQSNEPGLPGRILLCFSFYTNGEKLFNTVPRDSSLMCLNGIRVFSMGWIILGHTYMMGGLTSDNIFYVFSWTQKFSFLFIIQAMFSVDTFFVLSGLLVTYLYLKEHEKSSGKISWFKFYFHRYWRLTPVYAVNLFLFYNILSYYYIDGPFWSQQGLGGGCDDYWWKNMLYINNFGDDGCMGHTWYLANDMQFYVISPLILFFLTRYLSVSAIIAACLILTNWIATGVISTNNHFAANMSQDMNNQMEKIYNKPYCRIAPYVIGMICGYLLHRSKCQAKLNKYVVILGWLIATGLSSAIVFGIYDVKLSQEINSLYLALSRSTWSVALAWMIYACCNGYGGIVNSILAWPFWQPFGRLTYSTYLIHLAIIPIFVGGGETAVHFSHLLMISYFLASTACSYFAAIFISLSFEAPFMALEKLFL